MDALPTSNTDYSSNIDALTLPSHLLSNGSFNNHNTSNMEVSPSTYATKSGADTSNPDASSSTDSLNSTATHGIETSTYADSSSTDSFNYAAICDADVSTYAP